VRILHVIDELKLGGAGTHLATMVEHTSRQHRDVEHAAVSLFGSGALGARLEGAGCPVRIADLQRDVKSHRYRRALGFLENAIREEQPDVVEAHLTWSRLLALRAARRLKVPVRVGYEQGDIYMRSPRMRLANFVFQHDAQRVVVCSNALRRWAHRTHGVSWERLVVMHNSIETNRFAATARGTLGRFGFPPDTVLFVAVGTLGTGVNKRVDVCIDAVLECRRHGHRVALVVCGDGPQRQELESRALAAQDPSAVKFLGARQDVAQILSECDVFCHAAPFEPFGIVCVEAMAAGLPVVVPDGGGIHEAVSDGVTGFIYRALDVADLAEKMARLAHDADLRQRMGERGRQLAVSRFDMRAYMNRLLAMYRALLSASPRPA
jgi:glycosyltransferase involved in cell wall biosynthesis